MNIEIVISLIVLVLVVANFVLGVVRERRRQDDFIYSADILTDTYIRSIENEILCLCIYLKTLAEAQQEAVANERYEDAELVNRTIKVNVKTLSALERQYHQLIKDSSG